MTTTIQKTTPTIHIIITSKNSKINKYPIVIINNNKITTNITRINNNKTNTRKINMN